MLFHFESVDVNISPLNAYLVLSMQLLLLNTELS